MRLMQWLRVHLGHDTPAPDPPISGKVLNDDDERNILWRQHNEMQQTIRHLQAEAAVMRPRRHDQERPRD